MVSSLFPLQYLFAVVALWLNRQQQEVIDYLKEENRLLKEKRGYRKLQFTDPERGLARRTKALGRKVLSQLDTLVNPDTLRRSHRELVAQKWSHVERRKPGRPCTKDEIVALALRMAREGLGNRVIAANDGDFRTSGAIGRHSRLGGMLNYYYREAA